MIIPDFNIIIDNVDYVDGKFVNATIIDFKLTDSFEASYNYATDIDIPQENKETFAQVLNTAVRQYIMNMFTGNK